MGGQKKVRHLWRNYYENTQAVLFFIDSSDRARLDEAMNELDDVAKNDELKDAALLVYANKQDLSGAMSAAEIETRVQQTRTATTFYGNMRVQGSSATLGDGLHDGLDWLVEHLNKNGVCAAPEKLDRNQRGWVNYFVAEVELPPPALLDGLSTDVPTLLAALHEDLTISDDAMNRIVIITRLTCEALIKSLVVSGHTTVTTECMGAAVREVFVGELVKVRCNCVLVVIFPDIHSHHIIPPSP